MLEGDSAGRGHTAMRKKAQAIAFLFAIGCLFTSAFGRPSIQTLNSRPSLTRRRSLLADNTFDVSVYSDHTPSPISPLLTLLQPNAHHMITFCL